jgi:hypothetical protein
MPASSDTLQPYGAALAEDRRLAACQDGPMGDAPTSKRTQAGPSREEAAAIVAALELFMRATAQPPTAGEPGPPDPWLAAALVEGVSRDPHSHDPLPWLSTPG